MWTPQAVRKLVAQVAGVLFACGGFYLIVQGVQATGRINISSNLVSGQIESGSAGLLMLFLACFLIVLPSFGGGGPVVARWAGGGGSDSRSEAERRLLRRWAIATAAGIVVALALLFGGEPLWKERNSEVGMLFFMGGAMLGIGSALSLLFLVVGWVMDFQAPSAKDEPKGNRSH